MSDPATQRGPHHRPPPDLPRYTASRPWAIYPSAPDCSSAADAKRNRSKSPLVRGHWRHLGASAQMEGICGDGSLWFRASAPKPIRPVQGIREKAAEGIRTLDLLHGKQTL